MKMFYKNEKTLGYKYWYQKLEISKLPQTETNYEKSISIDTHGNAL